MTILSKLKAAIEQFAQMSGPVTFSACEDDGTVMLKAEYLLCSDKAKDGVISNSAWSEYGGNEILEAVGVTSGAMKTTITIKKKGLITEFVTVAKNA